MTIETVYDRSVLIARYAAMVCGLAVLCLMSGAMGAWLIHTKYISAPVPVAQAPTPVVQEDEQTQRLINHIQTMKVEHAKQIDGYKRVMANLKAQIAALTPRVNRVDDQLAILNEAAHRTPQPMTDRELETKTKQVLGIAGKVVEP